MISTAGLPDERVDQIIRQDRIDILVDLAGRERFLAAGIVAAQLVFVPHRPRPQYLELFNEVDLALDTFPYAGMTTTCDALWMGVPTVTLAGQ